MDEANVLKECFETPPPTPPQQQGKARRQVSSSLDFFPIFFFSVSLFSSSRYSNALVIRNTLTRLLEIFFSIIIDLNEFPSPFLDHSTSSLKIYL